NAAKQAQDRLNGNGYASREQRITDASAEQLLPAYQQLRRGQNRSVPEVLSGEEVVDARAAVMVENKAAQRPDEEMIVGGKAEKQAQDRLNGNGYASREQRITDASAEQLLPAYQQLRRGQNRSVPEVLSGEEAVADARAELIAHNKAVQARDQEIVAGHKA